MFDANVIVARMQSCYDDTNATPKQRRAFLRHMVEQMRDLDPDLWDFNNPEVIASKPDGEFCACALGWMQYVVVPERKKFYKWDINPQNTPFTDLFGVTRAESMALFSYAAEAFEDNPDSDYPSVDIDHMPFAVFGGPCTVTQWLNLFDEVEERVERRESKEALV